MMAAQAAQISESVPLWLHHEIPVHFLDDAVVDRRSDGSAVCGNKSLLLTQWEITEDAILQWANRWHYGNIPKFKICECQIPEGGKRRHSGDSIYVQLNGKLALIPA